MTTEEDNEAKEQEAKSLEVSIVQKEDDDYDEELNLGSTRVENLKQLRLERKRNRIEKLIHHAARASLTDIQQIDEIIEL